MLKDTDELRLETESSEEVPPQVARTAS